jgi:hypothetical protein
MVETMPHVYGGVCAPAQHVLRVAGSQKSNTKARPVCLADLGRIWGTFVDGQALLSTVSGKVSTREPRQGASNTLWVRRSPSTSPPSSCKKNKKSHHFSR